MILLGVPVYGWGLDTSITRGTRSILSGNTGGVLSNVGVRPPRMSLQAQGNSPDDHDTNENTLKRQRTRIAGVSVSDSGFYVILQVSQSLYWPIQVTSSTDTLSTTIAETTMSSSSSRPPQDTQAATSGQALTLLQLLGQIDMAGTILPPDILSQLVVTSASKESNANESSSAKLPPAKQALPIVTLDEVQIQPTNSPQQNVKFVLQCSGRDSIGKHTIVLPPTRNVDAICQLLQRQPEAPIVSYGSTNDKELEEKEELDPLQVTILSSFLSIALALRYKAPIVALLDPTVVNDPSQDTGFLTLQQVQERFPLYKSSHELQQTSDRVTHSIEQGFQVQQLQAALKVALEKQDQAAALKIRSKLQELEASEFEQLPVQPESDIQSMQ